MALVPDALGQERQQAPHARVAGEMDEGSAWECALVDADVSDLRAVDEETAFAVAVGKEDECFEG